MLVHCVERHVLSLFLSLSSPIFQNKHDWKAAESDFRYVGWFNSCKCWAAVWTLPKVTPHYVPIRLSDQERVLAGTYYGLIGGALALQIILSAAVLVFFYKELRLVYGGWVERPGAEGRGHADERRRAGERRHAEGRDDAERQDSIPLLDLPADIPGDGLALGPEFEDRQTTEAGHPAEPQ